jgi:hypothetical protein
MLHGFPNLWFVWRDQFRPLVEAGFYVVAPDLRGYNRSSKLKTVQDYGRSAVLPDIENLIDNLGGGEPAILVRHHLLSLKFHNGAERAYLSILSESLLLCVKYLINNQSLIWL